MGKMEIRRPSSFLSPYPDLVRDYSFLGSKEVPYGKLQSCLAVQTYKPLAVLVEMNLADVYPHPFKRQEIVGIPKDMISYLIEMRWEPQLGTLSQEQIATINCQVIEAASMCGFRLRDKEI